MVEMVGVLVLELLLAAATAAEANPRELRKVEKFLVPATIFGHNTFANHHHIPYTKSVVQDDGNREHSSHSATKQNQELG